jgi:hypothetical protein
MSRVQFYAGVFLTSATTLMLQTIESRILSVISWYHLVFFAVSIAMFGLTAGAVWVYLGRERFSEKTLSSDLAYFGAAYAITTVLSLCLQLSLAPVFSYSFTVFVAWTVLAVTMAAPFVYAGIIVSLALTRSPFPVGTVYGFDLLGAALGCLSVLLLLNHTDGPSAVMWTAALAALAAVAFAKSGIGAEPETVRPLRALFRRPGLIAAVIAAAAFLNGAGKHGLQPIIVKDQVERRDSGLAFEKWNSFSRIVASQTLRRKPLLWGPSPTLPADLVADDRYINIDGSAATSMYRFSGAVDEVEFLKYDLPNLAYFLPNLRRAAIIGVGGGRDVLSARVFGVHDITGVELNPILVDLLVKRKEFAEFAGLSNLDGIHLYVDEARNWFARSHQMFDLIQMSMIDTWAATGAGAFTLSENGLYTLEAWQVFLKRLTPSGLFTVSRWYAPGEVNETGRMVSLASATLMKNDIAEPRRHIFVASVGPIATLLLSRAPFTPEQIRILEDTARKYQYHVLISPDRDPESAVLRGILSARSLGDLNRYTQTLDLDLTPPTDDRPFFFNQLPFAHPGAIGRVIAKMGSEAGVAKGNLLATATLGIILVVSLMLVVCTILIPLRPAVHDVGKNLARAGTAYFLLIGFGFMILEIALLQRMSVFLGHPVYALSVVLFSIIVSTGMGSFLSERIPLNTRRRFMLWVVCTAAYIAALAAFLPGVLIAFDDQQLVARCVICVAAIAPCGMLLGFGFPTGMRQVSAVDRRPTPWFWGINGAAGVLASGIGIACSLTFGITVAFLIAAACYLLLIPAAMAGMFPAESVRSELEPQREIGLPSST